MAPSVPIICTNLKFEHFLHPRGKFGNVLESLLEDILGIRGEEGTSVGSLLRILTGYCREFFESDFFVDCLHRIVCVFQISAFFERQGNEKVLGLR